MNLKTILFSGIVTAIIGAILGIGLAEINRVETSTQTPIRYAVAGAIAGLGIGAVQETLRQRAHQEFDDIL
ncbi:MAG: hypothetical protein AAGF66_09095 [Cyanobacteria bacterium P01_H01_bin.119]